MRLCSYEDRPSDIVGVKLLTLSVLAQCPGLALEVTFPRAPPELVKWFADKAPAVLRTDPLGVDLKGFDVKPRVLLRALDEGADSAAWIDTDILVGGDLEGLLGGVPDDRVVVTEEFFGSPRPGGTLRTRDWGLRVGRALPATANSSVVRVNQRHRGLLTAWESLLGSESYRRAQAGPWAERPVHLVGDQDALTALLGSQEFADLPIHWIRRGQEIAQCFNRWGYPPHERLFNLASGRRPLLLHAQGQKPWRSDVRPRPYFLELSPYLLAAQAYAHALEPHEVEWLQPSRFLTRALRFASRDDVAMAGLLPSIGNELVEMRLLRTAVRRALRGAPQSET